MGWLWDDHTYVQLKWPYAQLEHQNDWSRDCDFSQIFPALQHWFQEIFSSFSEKVLPFPCIHCIIVLRFQLMPQMGMAGGGSALASWAAKNGVVFVEFLTGLLRVGRFCDFVPTIFASSEVQGWKIKIYIVDGWNPAPPAIHETL